MDHREQPIVLKWKKIAAALHAGALEKCETFSSVDSVLRYLNHYRDLSVTSVPSSTIKHNDFYYHPNNLRSRFGLSNYFPTGVAGYCHMCQSVKILLKHDGKFEYISGLSDNCHETVGDGELALKRLEHLALMHTPYFLMLFLDIVQHKHYTFLHNSQDRFYMAQYIFEQVRHNQNETMKAADSLRFLKLWWKYQNMRSSVVLQVTTPWYIELHMDIDTWNPRVDPFEKRRGEPLYTYLTKFCICYERWLDNGVSRFDKADLLQKMKTESLNKGQASIFKVSVLIPHVHVQDTLYSVLCANMTDDSGLPRPWLNYVIFEDVGFTEAVIMHLVTSLDCEWQSLHSWIENVPNQKGGINLVKCTNKVLMGVMGCLRDMCLQGERPPVDLCTTELNQQVHDRLEGEAKLKLIDMFFVHTETHDVLSLLPYLSFPNMYRSHYSEKDEHTFRMGCAHLALHILCANLDRSHVDYTSRYSHFKNWWATARQSSTMDELCLEMDSFNPNYLYAFCWAGLVDDHVLFTQETNGGPCQSTRVIECSTSVPANTLTELSTMNLQESCVSIIHLLKVKEASAIGKVKSIAEHKLCAGLLGLLKVNANVNPCCNYSGFSLKGSTPEIHATKRKRTYHNEPLISDEPPTKHQVIAGVRDEETPSPDQSASPVNAGVRYEETPSPDQSASPVNAGVRYEETPSPDQSASPVNAGVRYEETPSLEKSASPVNAGVRYEATQSQDLSFTQLLFCHSDWPELSSQELHDHENNNASALKPFCLEPTTNSSAVTTDIPNLDTIDNHISLPDLTSGNDQPECKQITSTSHVQANTSSHNDNQNYLIPEMGRFDTQDCDQPLVDSLLSMYDSHFDSKSQLKEMVCTGLAGGDVASPIDVNNFPTEMANHPNDMSNLCVDMGSSHVVYSLPGLPQDLSVQPLVPSLPIHNRHVIVSAKGPFRNVNPRWKCQGVPKASVKKLGVVLKAIHWETCATIARCRVKELSIDSVVTTCTITDPCVGLAEPANCPGWMIANADVHGLVRCDFNNHLNNWHAGVESTASSASLGNKKLGNVWCLQFDKPIHPVIMSCIDHSHTYRTVNLARTPVSNFRHVELILSPLPTTTHKELNRLITLRSQKSCYLGLVRVITDVEGLLCRKFFVVNIESLRTILNMHTALQVHPFVPRVFTLQIVHDLTVLDSDMCGVFVGEAAGSWNLGCAAGMYLSSKTRLDILSYHVLQCLLRAQIVSLRILGFALICVQPARIWRWGTGFRLDFVGCLVDTMYELGQQQPQITSAAQALKAIHKTMMQLDLFRFLPAFVQQSILAQAPKVDHGNEGLNEYLLHNVYNLCSFTQEPITFNSDWSTILGSEQYENITLNTRGFTLEPYGPFAIRLGNSFVKWNTAIIVEPLQHSRTEPHAEPAQVLAIRDISKP